MASPQEQAAKLLDFGQDLDMSLFDSVVECMYSGSGEMVCNTTFYQKYFPQSSSLESWTHHLTCDGNF